MTARVAAKQLAESGFQVTLYEREKLPRHKHCAGYVSPKSIRVLDSIGIDCRGTFDQTIRGMRIVCDGEDVEFNYTWAEDELPGNVCREHFDQLLVEHASASGVEIIDSTRVLGVSIPPTNEEPVWSRQRRANLNAGLSWALTGPVQW